MTPDLLIGHSMGEVAAATVSGALSIRDGAAVICRRAALLADLEDGGMAFVQADEQAARDAIGRRADRVAVAAANSSFSSVLAGDTEALDEVLADLSDTGVFCRRVDVDYASHCANVDPVLTPLRAALADVAPRPGSVPLHSTLLDEVVDGGDWDAGYWAGNLRGPVRFAAAFRAAVSDDRPTLFVEMSPHPVLVDAIYDELQAVGARGDAVGSLHRGEAWTVLLRAAGFAYRHGCDLRWDRVNPPGRFQALPAYPWQRERYWPEEPAAAAAAAPPGAHPAVDASGPELVRDRRDRVGSRLEAVISAVHDLSPRCEAVLEAVRWHGGARIGEELRTRLRPAGEGLWTFEVSAGVAAEAGFTRWEVVASGRCRAADPLAAAVTDVDQLRGWCTEVEPGPSLSGVWRRDGEAVARFDPTTTAVDAAVVDTVAAALPRPGGLLRADGIDEVRAIRQEGAATWCVARLNAAADAPLGDVCLLDDSGRVLVDLRGVHLARLEPRTPPGLGAATPLRSIIRPPAMPGRPPARSGPVLGGASGVASGVASGMVSGGASGDPDVPGARPGIQEHLARAVAEVLHVAREEVIPDVPLTSLGLDSLMAAEVRRGVRRDLQIDLPVRALLDGSGVAAVARRLSGGAGRQGCGATT